MLQRAGAGGPPVVFLPGAGLIGLDFWNLQQRAAAYTTAVVYDRGGTGWSDATDLPRSAAAVATELRDLLAAAGLPGPYVLAGHSLGGVYARRFAQMFPADVAALLLLDPAHEDLLARVPAEAAALSAQLQPDADSLPDLTAEQIAASRSALDRLYAAWPPAIRDALIDRKLATWRTGMREAANLETDVYAELRAGGPLPQVPLTVVTAMGANPLWQGHAPADLIERTQESIRALHADLAASVPGGRHVVLPDAQHQLMHVQAEDEISATVRDLHDAASG